MRYAVISDIHSNLEALMAVLSDIEKNNIDKILCLGDIVGYGPNPNECVELVKSKCLITIAGNHDVACIDESETRYFNRFAKQAISWTIDNLSASSYSFISQLPLQENLENFYLVHASPYNPSMWDYISSIEQAIYNFSVFDAQICFYGHSHVPVIFVEKNNNSFYISRENTIQVKEKERYLINIGSVGQPRDFNPKAAYAIMNTEKAEYQLIRIPYNYRETQQKMLENNLPYFLIERLENGR